MNKREATKQAKRVFETTGITCDLWIYRDGSRPSGPYAINANGKVMHTVEDVDTWFDNEAGWQAYAANMDSAYMDAAYGGE